LAEALGNERLSVRPLLFKGMMANLSNPSVAVTVLAQAAALAQRYEDHHVAALAWGNKAQAHAQLGQFAQARAALQEAQDLLQHTNSPLTASDVDLLTAWTYLAMGDAERALVYGQRSVKKAIATDNMDCICYGFDCVGYSDLELQKIDDAASAFSEAVKRSQASGAIIPQLLGQAGLGMTDFFRGRSAAIGNMEAALATMHAYHDDVGAAAVDRMLGACLLQTDDLGEAEDHFTAALHFYREMGMRPYLVRTLSDLARLFSAEDRTDEARAAQREADILWAALSDATA
jgi:tetratricopeptide (TPR) repeat protein